MMTSEQKAAFLANRAGKLTASRMNDAMSFLRNGQPSKERTKLQHAILAERLTGHNVRNVVTPDMERGLEYEDEMFDAFAEQTGRDLLLSRTYDHPTIEYFAASPDREMDGGEWLVEGKIPRIERFVEWRLAGVVPAEHHKQMLAQLACAGRKRAVFVAYCPEMKDERHRLFMRKFVPKPEEIAAVEEAAAQFLAELETLWERLTEVAA